MLLVGLVLGCCVMMVVAYLDCVAVAFVLIVCVRCGVIVLIVLRLLVGLLLFC